MTRTHPRMKKGWSSSRAWESMEGPAPHHSWRTARREKAWGSMATESTAKISPSSVILMRKLLSSSFALVHSFPFFCSLLIPFRPFLCLFHFLTFFLNGSLLLLLVNCTSLHGLIFLTQKLINIKSSKISLCPTSPSFFPTTEQDIFTVHVHTSGLTLSFWLPCFLIMAQQKA